MGPMNGDRLFLKNEPSQNPEKTGILLKGEADFHDAQEWDNLGQRYLARYPLPMWDVPMSVEAMERWCDRLGLIETAYKGMTGCSFQEFINLNPTWPLRAWIGTVLEVIKYADNEK